MARVTVEDCLEKVPNRFALIHLAAKRTKQLLKGSQAQVNAPENKEAVVALREIAEEKVRLPEGWDVRNVVIETKVELPIDQQEEDVLEDI